MKIDFFLRKRRNSLLIFLIFFALTLLVAQLTKFDFARGLASFYKALTWSLSNFYPNVDAMTKLPGILTKLRETIFMAIASTSIASIFALIFALFGSKVTKINGFLSFISRGLASVSRNIPIVAWAMILLFSFGQSSLTGFFALFIVTFGFLTRAFIEAIDETGSEPVEALKATGASYIHIVFQAIIPLALSQMISWTLYMIETNTRSATLLGILTGTGIGFSFDRYYKTMNYHAASLVVIVIVVAVFLIEYSSNYVRRKII
jgi:phosphonate transport system permease protein